MYYKFHCKFCDSVLLLEIGEDGTVICPYFDAQHKVKVSEGCLKQTSRITPPYTDKCTKCSFLVYDDEDNGSDEVKAYCSLDRSTHIGYHRAYCDKQFFKDNLDEYIALVPDIVKDNYTTTIVCKTLEQINILVQLITEIYRKQGIVYSFNDYKTYREPKPSTPYQYGLQIEKVGKRAEFARIYGTFKTGKSVQNFYSVYYALRIYQTLRRDKIDVF